MKIAVISPLYESVPPRLYGGTERVVSYLTEELVRQGHEVTLFASGDSKTGAALVRLLRARAAARPRIRDPLPHHLIMLDRVRVRRGASSTSCTSMSISCSCRCFATSARAFLTTLHGRLDLPDLRAVLPRASAMCRWCRSPTASGGRCPWANWSATVHHGLPTQSASPRLHGGGDYLAFLGRISPEKRPDRAIEIAQRVGMPLQDRGQGRRGRSEVFRTPIKPLLDPAWSSSSARSASTRRATFSATPRRCCSRSTGRSRSAW